MTSNRTVVIYALYDPRKPGLYRYVGQTVQGVDKRLKQHIYDALRGKSSETLYSANWINSLLRRDVRPAAAVLEETDQAHADEREVAWISELRQAGHQLTNATSGGGANKEVAAHIREVMRQNTSRYFADTNRRAEYSQRSKDLWADEAWRARWLAGSAARAVTGCKQGHEYTDENTYVSPRGSRSCRQCLRDASRRYQTRKSTGYQTPGRENSAAMTRERWQDPEYRRRVVEKMRATKRAVRDR